MTVTLTPNDNASVPPGGSAYLIKAYVYDSAAKAKAATQTDPGDYVQAYPIEGAVAQMEVTNHKYSNDMQGLSIQYAGNGLYFTQEFHLAAEISVPSGRSQTATDFRM